MRTWLNVMSPEMPELPLFMRLNDSCHFAATWARRASVAMVDDRVKLARAIQQYSITRYYVICKAETRRGKALLFQHLAFQINTSYIEYIQPSRYQAHV